MVEGVRPPKLHVVCSECAATLGPLALACPRCPDALPRAQYVEQRFVIGDRPDLFRFRAWLPPETAMRTSVGPAVLPSEKLAAALGLRNLAVAFSGYAPELGAENPTASFKDFEALPTLLYLREQGVTRLVLASAGSTARAFAHAAGLLDFPVVLVVPEAAVASVWTSGVPSEAVRLIALADSIDYAGAIRVSAAISAEFGIRGEGGARNVARRDGMGTVLLEYARCFGRLPAHYVQAVGSGTGGIAVWEAAQRLLTSGGVAGPTPTLHLAQNAPFTPLHDAWSRGVSIEPDADVEGQFRRIAAIAAPVLANRTPPYSLRGGVRDALQGTRGATYSVTNDEIAAAQDLYEKSEGLAVGPESGAAIAALRQALAAGKIGPRDPILLHVTGNAESARQHGLACRTVAVWRRVPADPSEAIRVLENDLGR